MARTGNGPAHPVGPVVNDVIEPVRVRIPLGVEKEDDGIPVQPQLLPEGREALLAGQKGQQPGGDRAGFPGGDGLGITSFIPCLFARYPISSITLPFIPVFSIDSILYSLISMLPAAWHSSSGAQIAVSLTTVSVKSVSLIEDNCPLFHRYFPNFIAIFRKFFFILQK